jgi:hypothetical protein
MDRLLSWLNRALSFKLLELNNTSKESTTGWNLITSRKVLTMLLYTMNGHQRPHLETTLLRCTQNNLLNSEFFLKMKLMLWTLNSCRMLLIPKQVFTSLDTLTTSSSVHLLVLELHSLTLKLMLMILILVLVSLSTLVMPLSSLLIPEPLATNQLYQLHGDPT